MKLVVISSPVALANEPAIINQLFGAGLEVLHLRKPNASAVTLAKLLHQISPVYYSRIALHQQHKLAKQFNIKRLHFPEQDRLHLRFSDIQQLQGAGYILSTSVHRPPMVKTLLPGFAYAFLSPVFLSISKPGYQTDSRDAYYLAADDKPLPVIALGGIKPAKIEQVKKMNYDGAAALGFIWQQPDQARENFKILQHACYAIALTC